MALLMILLRALTGKAYWWEGRGHGILAGRLSFFVVLFFGPVVQLLTVLPQSVAFAYVQIVSQGQPRTKQELQGQVLRDEYHCPPSTMAGLLRIIYVLHDVWFYLYRPPIHPCDNLSALCISVN